MKYDAMKEAQSICDNLELGYQSVHYIKEKLELAFLKGRLSKMNDQIESTKKQLESLNISPASGDTCLSDNSASS